MTWLAHLLGLDSGSGSIYLFWSGIGSDLGELPLLGLAVAFYRRHTCTVNSPRFCWRLGHPVPGTPLRACGKHHPAIPEKVTAEHIAQAFMSTGDRS